jgi:hypothetical protein
MPGLSTWDINLCCCPSCALAGGCLLIPGQTIHVTISGTAPGATYSGTMAYNGTCLWQICFDVSATSAGSKSISLQIDSSLSPIFQVHLYSTVTNCNGYVGGTLQTPNLCTSSCSPLNQAWVVGICGGARSMDITLTS